MEFAEFERKYALRLDPQQTAAVQAVEGPDARAPEFLVALHIAPAGDGDPVCPRGQLPGRVPHRKIRPHIPDACLLDPGFQHQFYRCRPSGVKYQSPTRKSLCHGRAEGAHLLCPKVVKHAGGKEHRPVLRRGVDGIEPGEVIQIGSQIPFPLPGGEQCLPHRHHVRQVDIVDAALPVVTCPAGAVQPAAQVHHGGPGMGAEILPHLKGQVALPHGDLQGAEGLEQAAGSLLQGGKIIVDLLQQLRCRLVGKQLGELSGTQRPAVQRNHQCLLDGILFNGMPLHISPHFLPTSRAEPDRNRVFPSQGVIKLPSAVGSSCAS